MLRYRLSNTVDPEERIEDAALWKALKDVFAEEIEIYMQAPKDQAKAPLPHKIAAVVDDLAKDGDEVALSAQDYMDNAKPAPHYVLNEGDILLGRQLKNEYRWPTTRLTADHIPYWHDPAFLEASGRFFELHDLNDAIETVRVLHQEGKGGFLKSIKTKHWLTKVPIGLDPMDAIGDMVYSFIDAGKCLMVQELVPMEYEMRFAIMDRRIVTYSPVAYWMTPLNSRQIDEYVIRTPTSHDLEWNPDINVTLRKFAGDLALDLVEPDCILDVCLSGTTPIAIELNPLKIGRAHV